MLPHQERVVEELRNLDGTINRLEVFTLGKLFASLHEDEAHRLRTQLTHMRAYAGVLRERIAAFK